MSITFDPRMGTRTQQYRPIYNQATIQNQNNRETQAGMKKSTKQALLLASLAGIAVATGVMVTKSKKPSPLKEIKATYERIIQEFPEDKKYYETLAAGINLPKGEEYKLASITGPAQLKSILKKASPQDFNLGENLEGVKNRTLRINLHNHTTASDGHLTPEEMIDQSARWADEVFKSKGNDGKPSFVLGITDHDTLDGAREAVGVIAKDPLKYKNLKLVLGSEISVSHTNPTDVREPMNFELIGYSLNPFNEKMNEFLETLKFNRSKVINAFTAKTKEVYPQYDFNEGDMKVFHRNLKNMRTNGVVYLHEEYLTHKMMFTDFVEEVNKKIIPEGQEKIDATKLFREAKDNYYSLKDTKGLNGDIAEYYRDYVLTPHLEQRGLLNDTNRHSYQEIFKKDFSDKKQKLAEIKKEFLPTLDKHDGYIITPEELFKTAKNSNEAGFFGVAHPGLVRADMYSKDVEDVCNASGFDKGEHLAWRLYSHLKQTGGDYFKATEANYQSYPYKDAGAMHWRKYMGEDKANEFGLLKSGGIDCHKTSIFKKHTLLSQEEINNNNIGMVVK